MLSEEERRERMREYYDETGKRGKKLYIFVIAAAVALAAVLLWLQNRPGNIAALPDLVASLDVQPADGSVVVRLGANNMAPAGSGPSDVRLTITDSSGNAVQTTVTNVAALSPSSGSTSTRTFSLSPGSYTATACIDIDNAIPESMENNNCVQRSFTINQTATDTCAGIKCQPSQRNCPDGFAATCENICSSGKCSSCTPSCAGHDKQPTEPDTCRGIACIASTVTCPDGFVASCQNSCSSGLCSSCTPSCAGHESQPTQIVSLTVLSPNGGETWEAGSSQTIRWTSSLPADALLNITLRHVQGLSFADYSLKNNTRNTGSSETFVRILQPDGTYKVVIKAAGSAFESSLFSIVDPPLTPPLPSTSSTANTDCLQLDAGNNDLSDSSRINIVLVGLNYASVQDFMRMGSYMIDSPSSGTGLFSVEPYKSNRNRFNLLVVNRIESVPNPPPSQTEHPTSYESPIIRLGQSCPYGNKRIVGIVNNNFRAYARFGTLSVTDAVYPANTSQFKKSAITFMHEAGHAIGSLEDEYIWHQSLSAPVSRAGRHPISTQCYYVNPNELSCGNTGSGLACSQPSQSIVDRCNAEAAWHDLVGNGCGQEGVVDCNENELDSVIEVKCHFSGCSPSSFISTRLGSMVAHSTSLFFSSVNGEAFGRPLSERMYGQQDERLICRTIRQITGSAGGICSTLCIDGCAAGQRCLQGVCTL